MAEEYPRRQDLRNGYKGTFFAEKLVILPVLKKGERCSLNIGGIIPSCHLWVNQRLSSVDSVIIGCRSWNHPTLAQTAENDKNTLIIADVYDDVIKDCIRCNARLMNCIVP